MAQDKTVDAFFVSSLNEALQQLKNISGLSVLAGCTTCPSYCDGTKIKLPPSVLFVKYVPELQAIARKERFIEFGSAVTLNAILDLGKNRIPSFFYDAVASVAFHNVRNLATLGGNICKGDHKMSLYSPLLAMDAVLEFKSYAETKRIAMSKFTGVPDKFLLTKIHIPVEDWSTAYFKRLGPAYKINELSVSYTFLADTSKGNIGDIRAAFCGPLAVRSRELENSVIGSRLPLGERDIESFLEKAAEVYEQKKQQSEKPVAPILKEQYLNLLHRSLKRLT